MVPLNIIDLKIYLLVSGRGDNTFVSYAYSIDRLLKLLGETRNLKECYIDDHVDMR